MTPSLNLLKNLSFLSDISKITIDTCNYVEQQYLAQLFDPLEIKARALLPVGFTQWLDSFLAAEHPMSYSLPLMNPFRVIFIIIGYFLMIALGMLFMSIVKPGKQGFKPKPLQIVHNFILMSVSAFMMLETLRQWRLENMSLFGNSIREGSIAMARITCIFYLSKILEFVDTMIMVLKKNFRQISFLHVYHHSSIFLVWWYVIFFAPGGESYFSVVLNSFIHVIMYAYYLSTTIGVPLVFIKPYITSMQMLQFTAMMIQAIYDLIMIDPATCNYPRSHMLLLAIYMVTMLGLFANFFMKDAQRRKKLKAQQRKKTA